MRDVISTALFGKIAPANVHGGDDLFIVLIENVTAQI